MLAIDPTPSDLSTCAFVVKTGEEVSRELPPLSSDDGWQLTAAISAVWLTAAVFKWVIRTLQGDDDVQES